jgi:hypothetical protein
MGLYLLSGSFFLRDIDLRYSGLHSRRFACGGDAFYGKGCPYAQQEEDFVQVCRDHYFGLILILIRAKVFVHSRDLGISECSMLSKHPQMLATKTRVLLLTISHRTKRER